MTKKTDIFERLSRSSSDERRGDAGAPRPREETVRVSRGVLRRRPRRSAPVEESAPEQSRPATVVRRAAPEAPTEKVEAAPTPAPEPVQADAAPAPQSAPQVAPEASTAPKADAPVVVAAAPAQPEVKAEPAKVEASAPTPEPVAVAAAPAAPTQPTAAPAPKAPPKPDTARPERPRFRGLGLGVVVPPPGYDPTNPEAYRERQRREAAAGTSTTPATRRRRVASGTPGPAARPGSTGPAAPAGGRPPRRGRSRGRGRMNHMIRPRRRKKSGPKVASPQPKAQKRKVRVDGTISVGNLAHALSLKAPLIIKKLIELGMPATINEMLDLETSTIIAAEFEYEVENVGFDENAYLQHVPEEEEEEELEQRPPVVTIMGHVDHGKTTLLDTIRKARVAAGEAGGITQHIGAYQVDWNDHVITFLDTPGHAAFSAMRARGASITDIVVLVVAADDGVQPQTVEAIAHARAAGVPIIVAVNKIDKIGVNPDVIKQRLGEHDLVPEEWGGDTMFVNISALKDQGIEELLESIVLQAEVMDLQANSERHAEGVVIEAKLERGRGPVATILIKSGTLKRNDHVVIGASFGKVRAMVDFRNKPLKEAGPSMPVEIFGLSELPNTGDDLAVVKNEKNARTLADHRGLAMREQSLVSTRRRTVDDLRMMAGEDERKTLLLVLKADVQGSLEALKASVLAVDVPNCEVRILHSAVGNISESDVNLVAANDGLLVGFNVKVDARARRSADEAGVQPELYTIIYQVLDRVEGLLRGMLEPVYEEQRQGSAEVRALFKISRIGTIAGSYVLDGKIGRSHGARVLRKGKEVWNGSISTLKRFKDDVKEVASGYECGITLDGYNDLLEGDVIETFAMIEVAHPGS